MTINGMIDKIYEVINPKNLGEDWFWFPNKLVSIWDVLDWVEKNLYQWNWRYTDEFSGVIDMRTFKNREINMQSIQCIKYVYKLIKNFII